MTVLVDTSPRVCEFRLSLVSGNAVPTTDQVAKSTLYWTPISNDGTITTAKGRVALYDGTRFKFYEDTEKSLSLTLTSGKNYDVFLYDNAGTLTLELSAAWTNDTTRADALTTQNGVYVKSGATTRRWLGTIRASAANQTEDSDVKRYVWNAYNQEARRLHKSDTTDSYDTASTSLVNWLNNAANQVDWVQGLASPFVDLLFLGCMRNDGAGNNMALAIGVDTTSANSAQSGSQTGQQVAATGIQPCSARYFASAGLGYHYARMMAIGGAGTTRHVGDNGNAATYGVSGMTGYIMG